MSFERIGREIMKSKRAIIIICIVAAAVLMIAGIFISTNNRAISLEEQILSADSDIQTQEKRRTDLIYNLADCVMQYDKHEADTLISVVEARNENTADIENVTTSIAAVAEAYPELKSNENYKELMNELSTTENLISQYRTSYNNEVRSYNKFVRKFPNKQILSMMGYETINYTYLEYSDADREPIKNMFGE
jgi:LemA protein